MVSCDTSNPSLIPNTCSIAGPRALGTLGSGKTSMSPATQPAGTKNDAGKVGLHLLPPGALFEIAQVLDFGVKKYAAWNWSKGMAASRLFAAALGHLWAWWCGEENDPETNLPHLAHLGVRLEAHHHPGRIAAQAPNGGRHGLLCFRRQTIKPAQTLLITPAATFHAPLRHIMPLRIRGNDGAFRLRRSLRGLREGKTGGE